MSVPIAVSTGWLFAHDEATRQTHERIVRAADGLELSLADEGRLDVYDGTGVETDQYCSFHLPARPTNIPLFSRLAAQYRPTTAVIHPTDLSPNEIASLDTDGRLNLAVENMDIRKETGRTRDSLAEYVNHSEIDFVLDVQHVYEHDASMEYGWDLLGFAGDSLRQFHVSGETHNNPHALLKNAENRDTILNFLREAYEVGLNVPIVLEGEYTTPQDVRDEVEVVRNAVY